MLAQALVTSAIALLAPLVGLGQVADDERPRRPWGVRITACNPGAQSTGVCLTFHNNEPEPVVFEFEAWLDGAFWSPRPQAQCLEGRYSCAGAHYFSAMVFDPRDKSFVGVAGQDEGLRLVSLPYGTAFCVRVRSRRVRDEVVSPWGERTCANTGFAPARPPQPAITLIKYHAGGGDFADPAQALLYWDGSAAADSYDVQRATAQGLGPPVAAQFRTIATVDRSDASPTYQDRLDWAVQWDPHRLYYRVCARNVAGTRCSVPVVAEAWRVEGPVSHPPATPPQLPERPKIEPWANPGGGRFERPRPPSRGAALAPLLREHHRLELAQAARRAVPQSG